MLDRLDGRNSPDALPVPLQLSALRDARSQLRAGLTGLEQLTLFDERTEAKDSPLPLKENESEAEFIAKLELDLTHLESLVKPYAGGDITKYLKALETAISIYGQNAAFLSARLGVRIEATRPVRHLQDRFHAVNKAIEERKRETFGDKSIFIGKTIVTYTADGREITRKIKEIPSMLSDHADILIVLDNNDGATTEAVSLTTLNRLRTKTVSYGPVDGKPQSLETYIRNCFGPKTKMVTKIETSPKETVVYLSSKSGRIWSIHCKFNEKPQDVFGTPALVIDKVSNWQKIIPDPLLIAYQGQRLTIAQVDGIAGYMNMNEPQEPKTASEKLFNFADNVLDKGTQQLHRMGDWFKKKFR